jgi:hypothetical protein
MEEYLGLPKPEVPCSRKFKSNIKNDEKEMKSSLLECYMLAQQQPTG